MRTVLFIGLGSIGQRHLRNLISLGNFKFYAYRKLNRPLPEEFDSVEINLIQDLEEIVELKVSFAIISCPPNIQDIVLPKLCAYKVPCFIEKPGGVEVKSFEYSASLFHENDIYTRMGYNLRFHPMIIQLKDLLESNEIGNINYASLFVGQFLPDWRPSQDYRTGYGAIKEMGGGVQRDLIHEIDLVYFLFGFTANKLCHSSHNSNLKISTNDTADYIFHYDDRKLTCHVHMDYLQRSIIRRGLISGSLGTIEYDLVKNELYLLKKEGNDRIFSYREFERNDMYLKSLVDFISNLNTTRDKGPSILDGLNVLKMTIQ